MAEWHHQLSGPEFEQAPGDGGQGSLACCSPRGLKESDTAEQLSSNSCSTYTVNPQMVSRVRGKQCLLLFQ